MPNEGLHVSTKGGAVHLCVCPCCTGPQEHALPDNAAAGAGAGEQCWGCCSGAGSALRRASGGERAALACGRLSGKFLEIPIPGFEVK